MFYKAITEWYIKNERSLPWRETQNPYSIWVSEIMLQQTKIETVIPYYERFMKEMPNVEALASASLDTLMKLWQGLGYYSRIKNMQKAAQRIVELGEFPKTYEELIKLPGIGDYTASAIASFAFMEPVITVDGNVMRVYERVFDYEENVLEEKTKKYIRSSLEKMLGENSSAFNQGMMELGEIICLPLNPQCDKCPCKVFCRGKLLGKTNSLPVRVLKQEKKVEKKTLILYEYQGSYLLRQRTEKLLHHTFEPYEGTLEEKQGNYLGHFKHVFSHLIWEMDVYKIILTESLEKEGYQYYTKDEIIHNLPIATTYWKWMKKYI